MLTIAGAKDGQTIMVKDGKTITAHTWNASEGRWDKIGEVVGGSGGSQQASGKQLYEGKVPMIFHYVSKSGVMMIEIILCVCL